MSNSNQFDWVAFYKELASKLLQFKNGRDELVAKVLKIYEITHEGSGLASMVSDVKKMCKGADVQKNGLAIKGSQAKESKKKVTEWL